MATSELDGITNFLAVSDHLGTAGQPARDEFAAVAAAGYQVIINLAMPESTGALPDEAAVVAAHGMEYVHIPVVWERPTIDDVERFFAAMERYRGRKVFVHCALNMRVSCFVWLYRVVIEGVALDEATGTMMRIWQPDDVWQRFLERALAHYAHQRPPRRSQHRASIIRPSLAVLSPAQVEEVHDHSLRILATVGVRVDSPRALNLLTRAAGRSGVDDRVVRLPAELVEWALHVAPRELAVHDRRGNLAFRLPGEARFGIGVTSLYYQRPETGDVVPFAREHMALMARLANALPAFDVVSTVGIVQDVPPHLSDLYGTLDMVANTTRPLVILVSAEEAFPAVLDLLQELGGSLSERPWVLPYFNPISPLVINEGTADKMFLSAERGIPFIYSNYGMAGASTPISPSGALALLNAELLAGLALGQLVREGTPMLLGSLPAYFDMRGMGSFYDAHSYLIDLACAEMMSHYRIPHVGTSGAGMGWGADLIAAGHQWINHLVSCAGKVGLVPFVGDNLGSKAFSPEIVVYAAEVIEQARRFARGFDLDVDAVGLPEIAAVGPGGDYLMSRSTLANMRRAYHQSDIFPRLTLEEWQARGRPDAAQVLRERTIRLLAEAPAPDDRDDLLARGEAFVRASSFGLDL